MATFNDEPIDIIKYKTALLICGVIGFLFFLFLYLVAWLYPIVSSTFTALVLFELMHPMIFIATCLLRGVKNIDLEYFVVYLSAYVISTILDLIGSIWKTVLFSRWSGAVVDTVIGYVVVIFTWLLLVVDVVQLVLSAKLGSMFKVYTNLQNTLVALLAEDNGIEYAGTLREEEIKKMAKNAGWSLGTNIRRSPARTSTMSTTRRPNTSKEEE